MSTFSAVFEGVLATQIVRLAPDKTLLDGPEDRIVLPGEMLYDSDIELQFQTYSAIDVPGYRRDEISRPYDYARVTLNLSAATDPETLALLCAVNSFGTADVTYGIEALCEALSCFCDPTESCEVAIVQWLCAKGCKGGQLLDPATGLPLYGFQTWPCLRDLVVSEFPGVNRPGEDPDPWTLTGTAYGNQNYGTGPGSVYTTDDPDGLTCYYARGLTPVPPPVPCDVDCETFEWGYASGALALD